jgi:hypothetical protein
VQFEAVDCTVRAAVLATLSVEVEVLDRWVAGDTGISVKEGFVGWAILDA